MTRPRSIIIAVLLAATTAACGTTTPPSSPASSDRSHALVAPSHTPRAGLQRTTVTRVVDGDTIVTPLGHVRVLGINAPETTRGHHDCGGQQATDLMRSMVDGKAIRLISDRSQGDRDRYGRLLRYVHVTQPGSDDTGLVLVRRGWARVYEQYPVARTPRYRQAQEVAQRHHRGVWGLCR